MDGTTLRGRGVLYKGSHKRQGLVLPSLETSLSFDLFAAPGTLTLTPLVNKTASQPSRPFTCQNALLTMKSPTTFERTFTLKTNITESKAMHVLTTHPLEKSPVLTKHANRFILLQALGRTAVVGTGASPSEKHEG